MKSDAYSLGRKQNGADSLGSHLSCTVVLAGCRDCGQSRWKPNMTDSLGAGRLNGTLVYSVFRDTSGEDLMRAVMYIRQDLYFTVD